MEILEDLKGSVQFAKDHHVYKFLAQTPHSSISIVGWSRARSRRSTLIPMPTRSTT